MVVTSLRKVNLLFIKLASGASFLTRKKKKKTGKKLCRDNFLLFRGSLQFSLGGEKEVCRYLFSQEKSTSSTFVRFLFPNVIPRLINFAKQNERFGRKKKGKKE